ncbi:MAG: DUF4465 domain-containing protein [Bacteroidaceae bacterium]|nr:DUF4465 domain-containing protein [Bacteroidaceae bacterium]
MKQKLLIKQLLCLLFVALPTLAWADREVKQPVFGKQVITVADDEVITFVDPKGDTDYTGQTSENCQGMTVFKPAVEGKSVQIVFEYMNMGGSGSYYSVANVYNGNPDADNSFTWATSTSTVPTSYSASVLPSGDILRAFPNERNKTYENETYFSTSNDGMLSVGFAYRYAYSCKGWKAKVKLVALNNMQTKGAAADYSAVPTSVKSKQNVALAGFNVTTEGVMNADNLTGVKVKFAKNEGVVNPSDLKLYDASGNDLNATITADGENHLLTVNKTLVEGKNDFLIKGDFLGTAEIGAKVQLDVLGVTTTAMPDGVTPFTSAESVELENPALVLMSSTPQTVTVGDTPLAFFDEGGADGKIKQNVNGTITFLPATPSKKVMIDVTKMNIWLGTYYVQEFRVYNGTEVKADKLIKTLNNGETGIIRSTSEDGALTVNLFANTSATTYENDGWEATVSQFTPQAMTVEELAVEAASTATCSAGDDAEMLKVTILTENTEPALVPSSFSVDCGENYALVSKVAIYSTGTSGTYAATKKIGEADVTAQNVTVPVSNAVSLVEGNNYFWVTYTLSTTAKSGKKVSAKLANVKFTNDATVTYDIATAFEREVKNIAIATEGTKTVMVDGTFGLQSEQYPTNANYTAPGTTDRIVVFKPANEGNVCEIEFSKFEIYYASSSYGTKAKFQIYSGEGTKGEKLYEVTAPTSGSYNKVGPGEKLRSTSADGAITVVYNPNTSSYYYCGEGFTANVSEYKTKAMEYEETTVAQTSSDVVAVGAKNQALLTLNVNTSGTNNPLTLSKVNIDLKDLQQNIAAVKLYAVGKNDADPTTDATPVATATVGENSALILTLAEPLELKEGDNYLRLTADIAEDAVADAKVDAKVLSLTIGGEEKTIEAGDPDGERTVKYMYLLQSGDNGEVTIGDNTIMFYDDGGAEKNASRNFTGQVTFVPNSADKAIKFVFKTSSFGNYSDHLYIYNGAEAKTSADVEVGMYDAAPEMFISESADGKLTVKFSTASSTTSVTNFAIEVSAYQKQPLAVASITTEDTSDAETLKGAQDVKMQKIAIEAAGDMNDIKLSAVNVNATNAEVISKVKVYATDTYSTFSTTNLIGEADAAGNIAVDYTINKRGTYYLWVTCDIASDATIGNKPSASVTAITANGEEVAVAEPSTSTIEVVSGKSGTIAVGPGTAYPTIQSAINSLAIGVEGPVVLSVKKGKYNERLMIPAIKGVSATNTVTIQSETGLRGDVEIYHDSYTSPAYGETGYGVVTFDNANYITLKDVTVKTEAPQYKGVVYVRNASRHITIDGCYLSAPTTTQYSEGDINIIGHYVDNSKDADGNYLCNNNNDYLTIKNNIIEGGYIGISMGGTSYVALPKEVGGVIENNIIRGWGSKGIYVMEELGTKINGNKVYNVEYTASSALGLDMQVGEDNTLPVEVTHNTFYIAASNTASAMSFRKLIGTAENPVDVSYNEVRVVSKYSANFGVKFSNGNVKNVNFDHNSIRVTNAQYPVSDGATGLWFSSTLTDGAAANVNVTNNIVANEATGFAVNLYNDGNLNAVKFANNTLYTAGATFARASSGTTMDYAAWTTKTGETGGENTLVAFKDEFRLFPAAEVGDRGCFPYDANQAAATHAEGDPAFDVEMGGGDITEPTNPELLVDAEYELPLGEEAQLYATLTEGTAPYTVTWKDSKNTVIKTETLESLPESPLTCTITPQENADYTVTVVDANLKEVSAAIRVITTGDAAPATFENLYLDEESEFSGIYELEDEDDFFRETTFVNGSYSFYQGTWPDYDTWWGIGYSNHTSTEYAGLDDQFNSIVGTGVNGSENYALAYYMANMGPGYEPAVTITNKPQGDVVPGMYVTNTAYAVNSMENGDEYAKKFGYGDWFKLTATGYDAAGNNTGSVDFYLADFRSDNASERYIVKDWRYMDLSALGTVKKIVFTMSSSDNSKWGMNTPSYFAFDDFGVAAPGVNVTIGKNGWSTFASKHNMTIPEGITAYYATAANNSTVTLEEITDGIIPAGEGVVLNGVEGETYTFMQSEEEGSVLTGNLMVGVTDPETFSNNGHVYVISTVNDETAFYHYTGATFPEGKAYLNMPTAMGAKVGIKFNDDATGINSVRDDESVMQNTYNTNGVRVNTNAKGIVIKNGRKVLVK